MKKLNNYDWYCDSCDLMLNGQPGFNANCGTWVCTECGYENTISEDNILSDDELFDYTYSGYDSYEEYKNRGEGISVSEAALIWKSHGKDEDYMFGYTEEELENA